MNIFANLRIALVHHWLVTRRGGERVLEALAELFPNADIFTLISSPGDVLPAFEGRRVHKSFLQKIPWASRCYPYFLPLFPAAVSRIDLSGYDLIISSDAAVMKGVHTDPAALHICYCHTPMRYVWSGFEDYCRTGGPAKRLALSVMRDWLRRWDFDAAQRATLIVANSQNVQNRIRECYNRDSFVIYPPVDTDRFIPGMSDGPREGFFLLVSHLVPYKRVDIVVEAFNRCGKKLVVIGEGPETSRLMRIARPNIQLLGSRPQEEVVRAMQECKAFVFAGEEDFGIVMAEAQACGKPVIALAKGGAREIVKPGITGVLFEEQSVESLLDAIEQFEILRFEPQVIRSHSLRFRRPRFLQEFLQLVERTVTKTTATCRSESASCAFNAT